jgi:hypothetical protein
MDAFMDRERFLHVQQHYHRKTHFWKALAIHRLNLSSKMIISQTLHEASLRSSRNTHVLCHAPGGSIWRIWSTQISQFQGSEKREVKGFPMNLPMWQLDLHFTKNDSVCISCLSEYRLHYDEIPRKPRERLHEAPQFLKRGTKRLDRSSHALVGQSNYVPPKKRYYIPNLPEAQRPSRKFRRLC